MFIISGITSTWYVGWLIGLLLVIAGTSLIAAISCINTEYQKLIKIFISIVIVCVIALFSFLEYHTEKIELESREFVRYFISESFLLQNTDVGDNEILIMMYNEKVNDLNKALEYAKESYGVYITSDPRLYELKPLELIEVI